MARRFAWPSNFSAKTVETTRVSDYRESRNRFSFDRPISAADAAAHLVRRVPSGGGIIPCLASDQPSFGGDFAVALALSAVGVTWQCRRSQFGGSSSQSSVGGVKIDADGVVSNPASRRTEGTASRLAEGLAASAGRFAEVDRPAVRFAASNWKPKSPRLSDAASRLPDAVRFLAGLQRVKYVLVYPGPARHRARRPGRRLESRCAGQRGRRRRAVGRCSRSTI